MSRIGNKPIEIPADVTVEINGNHITVKGPKGTLERDINPKVKVMVKENKIIATIDNPADGNLHGLTRTLVSNMVEGVEKEFTRDLEINGVGYTASLQNNKLTMKLGYSHLVIMDAPEGIKYEVKGNIITIRGIDKELVGQTAAVIRSKRPPEVYKGKGIKYVEEHIRRKEGKTGKK